MAARNHRGYSAQRGCLSEKNRRYTGFWAYLLFSWQCAVDFPFGKRGKTAGKKRFRLRPGRESPALYLILILAGIVHGIFVSGGPLLISYLTKKNTG